MSRLPSTKNDRSPVSRRAFGTRRVGTINRTDQIAMLMPTPSAFSSTDGAVKRITQWNDVDHPKEIKPCSIW
jgi:hypothetical protein